MWIKLKPFLFAGAIILNVLLAFHIVTFDINIWSPKYLVEPALKKYVVSFNKECKGRGLKPNTELIKCVKFPGETDNDMFKFNEQQPYGDEWAGVALTNKNTGAKYVFLNPQTFYMSDETGREMLVYHELFHAFFNTPHQDNELLKPTLSDADALYYLNNRKAVLDKVFSNVK